MSSNRLTRADAIRIYEKVMHDVLGIPDASHPLRVALDRDGVTSLITLLSLSSSDIENLSYLPEQVDGDPIPRLTKVNAGHRGLIRQFQAWIVFLGVRSGGGTLTLEEYENLSPDAFDDFRISNATTSTQGTLPTVGSGASPRPAVSTATYTAHDFKRSIRRDTNAYPVLKDDKHWNNWNRSVISQARAHDVSDVFDRTYVPSTIDDATLFKEKQSFVYSMFNRCVQTDSGKSIVRDHEENYDAQAVYRKLEHHAKMSTKAQLAKDTLMTDLTTSKLDSSWRGTNAGFILMWKEKMRLFEDMTPNNHRYAPEIKRSMLENSVSLVAKLNSVKDISNQVVAIVNPPLEYEAYCDLLISASNQLDKLNQVPTNRSKRHVNQTNTSNFRTEEDYYGHGYLDAGDDYFDHTTIVDEQEVPNESFNILAAEGTAQETKKVFPSCRRNFGTPFLRKFVRSFVTIGLQTLVPMGITNTVDAVEPPIAPMDNNASTSMTKTTRIMILTLFHMLEKTMGRESNLCLTHRPTHRPLLPSYHLSRNTPRHTWQVYL